MRCILCWVSITHIVDYYTQLPVLFPTILVTSDTPQITKNRPKRLKQNI